LRQDLVTSGRIDRGRGLITENGEVRFTAPVLFDADPAGNEGASGRRLLQELLDEHGLADARFAGDEHDLACAAERSFEVATQRH
jgi:hypothetical protein